MAASEAGPGKEQISREVQRLVLTASKIKLRLFGELGRLNNEQDADRISQWLLSDQVLPDKELFKKLWNSIMVQYANGSKDIIEAWLGILAQKWHIPKEMLRPVMVWMAKNKIIIKDVSDDNLGSFFEDFVTNHQLYPNLGPPFIYNLPSSFGSNRKMYYLKSNIERMMQMSLPDFIKGKVVLKSPIEGTNYFIAIQYSLAESTNGYYVTLGEEQHSSVNPLKGVFFRIGLDTQVNDLRIVMMQGVKNRQNEINSFAEKFGNLHPGVALMYIALELAAQGHLRFNDNGFESPERPFKRLMGVYPQFIPTMKNGTPTINILSNYTRFGLRQKTSYMTVTKGILEKNFPGSEGLFDWLMENNYFEANEGAEGRPKLLTTDMINELHKQYPPDSARIIDVLQNAFYRWQSVDYLKSTFIPQYLDGLDKRSDDASKKKSEIIKKMIATFHELRPIEVVPEIVEADDPQESGEGAGPVDNAQLSAADKPLDTYRMLSMN